MDYISHCKKYKFILGDIIAEYMGLNNKTSLTAIENPMHCCIMMYYDARVK